MGLFGGKSKSKSKSKTGPWEPQQPYIKRGFEYAQNAYNNSAPTWETQTAWNRIADRAVNGSPLTRQASNHVATTLRGDYLNQGNPYLQNVIDSTSRQARQGVDSTYAVAGRYGSGAHDQAVAQTIGDITGHLRYNDYSQQLARMDQVSQFAPQLAAQDYVDLNALRGVGADRENFDFERAARYMQLINGNYGSVSSGTTTQKNSSGIGDVLLNAATSFGSKFEF